MTMLRPAEQMSLPPPLLSELRDGTGVVGWIDENRIGFGGFDTLMEAAGAAWVAHVALERRAAEGRREPAPYFEAPQLTLVRDGADEWIVVDDKRIARLLRPGDSPKHSNRASPVALRSVKSFGFEIIFPRGTSALAVESSSHVVYLGLRRSGLPWAVRPGWGLLRIGPPDHSIAVPKPAASDGVRDPNPLSTSNPGRAGLRTRDAE